MELTITKIGDAAGIILPPDLLARMQLKDGDTVHVSETAGGITLSAHDADLAEAMMHAERVMTEDDAALRRLAE